MAKTVKLTDIAKILNVSIVTVSKALSGKKGVSEDLRKKIKQLADKMGYIQSSSVRKSEGTRSYSIGVLISDRYLDFRNSFYWEMYQCVVRRAAQKNCFTVLEVLSGSEESAAGIPRLLCEKKVDGLIILGLLKKNYLENLSKEAHVPYVYLDFYTEKQNCSSVVSNGFFGMYQLTNYLFDMGHTKIAYVGTLLYTKSITDRFFGYAKSLLEHGQKVRDEWVIPDRRDMETGTIDFTGKLEALKEMPTAFVCNCDLVASVFITDLKSKGYRVPDDFSVVGFDNYIYPDSCDVEITTYEVDMKEMAHRSINALLGEIEGEKRKTSISVVDGYPVYKKSVKRITKSADDSGSVQENLLK